MNKLAKAMLHLSLSFHMKLGLTDLNDHTSFKLVTQLVGKKIVAVACGADFSLALTGTYRLHFSHRTITTY
jgi:hypothetical protein